ncbi:MAG: cell division protein FtsQ/DivIB [Wenzhouxiangella sp.]
MADSEHQPDRLMSPALLATLLLGGLLLLAAFWLRAGVIGAERFAIQWLDVEGELSRTSSSQIRAAAAPQAASGFFAVDLARVRQEIEALPWVAGAEVSRHWPDALHIRVSEHRPVARWNDEWLLSQQGEAFAVTGAEGMQGLPRLYGPDNRREDVLANWLAMRDSLFGSGLEIERLTLDQRGAWTLGLDNGIELLLGRQRVDERLLRFLAVQDQINQETRRAVRVDMRYTNGLAVRWATAGDDSREQTMGDNNRHG